MDEPATPRRPLMAPQSRRGNMSAKGLKRREAFKPKSVDISKGSIRRLARRGGVKRMADGVYCDTRTVLVAFLRPIVQDAAAFAEHGRRFTVRLQDVLLALKRRGRTMYGFGEALPGLDERAGRLRRRPNAEARKAATQALARRLPARAALPGPGTPAEGARGGTTALACGEAAPPSRFAPGSERRMLSAPVALHETLNLSATEAAGVAAGAAADGVGTQETEGDAAGDAVEDLPDAVYDRLQKALSDFRFTPENRVRDVFKVDELVAGAAAQLPGAERALCTRRSLYHVLLALEGDRDALMLDGEDVRFCV